MLPLFSSQARGKTETGWLQSRHSFSFGAYYDPERLGFGLLRVLNEDEIAPGTGFGEHPHRDMEIVIVSSRERSSTGTVSEPSHACLPAASRPCRLGLVYCSH